MLVQQGRTARFVEAIQQANVIAASTTLDELLDQMLGLIVTVAGAESGTLYLHDRPAGELVFTAVRGPADRALVGRRIPANQGLAGHALAAGQALFIDDVASDPRWDRQTGALAADLPRTALCLPLMIRGEAAGLVQLFNLDAQVAESADERALLELLGSRLITEVEKTRLLDEARHRERRQQALVEIIARLTTTLEPDTLLDRILEYARDLLEVEATSIWLRDEATGELLLHLATGNRRDQMRATRIPAGHGIIGYVVQTGETVVVNDAQCDSRFYRAVDQRSGFVTRSILCVPLRAPRILLGGGRGDVAETIVGGMQALNPRSGQVFSSDDVSLLVTLAGQAATVLRLARLYSETDSLFNRVIDAITGAIDLKDPYTRGHSQRVSDYSVAIAQELGLPPDEIYRIRISSKLHDVGKIRVPDAILKKPDRLDDEEFREMRRHPSYGLEFLRDNGLLDLDLLRDSWQALAQHHERLDGKGYPLGLRGEEISLVGRIVAVADVFDAITSDRPYRPGMPIEQAMAILQRGAGTELDPVCVEALIRARARGAILTQAERARLELEALPAPSLEAAVNG